MFNQSCSLLQNKNQSPLSGPISHNLSLFSTRNYASSTKTFIDIKPNPVRKPTSLQSNPSQTNMNLLDFAYSLNNSTSIRPNLGSDMKNLQNITSMKSKNYIKEVAEIPSIPITSYFLVGGFVGSKSQLGCRSNHCFDLNMWDLIRNFGLIHLFKCNPSVNKNFFCQQNSPIGSNLDNLVREGKILSVSCTTNLYWPLKNERPCKNGGFVFKKQSYAEVVKNNLPIASSIDGVSYSSAIVSPIIGKEKDSKNCTMHLPSSAPPSQINLPVSENIPVRSNNEDGIKSCELDLKRITTVKTNLSMAAYSGSPMYSSTNVNSQTTCCDKDLVTSCEISNWPRPLPTTEVKTSETSALTVNSQIILSVDSNGVVENEKGQQFKQCATDFEPVIKSILKNTLNYTNHFNDEGESTFEMNRNRIISQCSDDSEDSFIVFEQSEDDTSDYDDDGDSEEDEFDGSSSCESDEDSLLTTEHTSDRREIMSFSLNRGFEGEGESKSTIRKVPQPNFGDKLIQELLKCTKKPNCSFTSVPEVSAADQLCACQTANTSSHSQEKTSSKTLQKRVRFAEGADLVLVIEIDSTEPPERGEWEMYALDHWRFKQRVQQAEASLRVVLEPTHRQRIYRERFLDTDR